VDNGPDYQSLISGDEPLKCGKIFCKLQCGHAGFFYRFT
jgi:hypothetical protein